MEQIKNKDWVNILFFIRVLSRAFNIELFNVDFEKTMTAQFNVPRKYYNQIFTVHFLDDNYNGLFYYDGELNPQDNAHNFAALVYELIAQKEQVMNN